jgi:hypothetical protein
MTDMRTYLASRADAGPIQTDDVVMVLRDVAGTLTWFKASPGHIGLTPSRDLVVDGTTRIKVYDPATDRGYTLRSKGVDTNIVQIPNYAFTQLDVDADGNEPYFLVARRSDAMVYVNGSPGANLKPGPICRFQADTPDPLADEAAMLAFTGVKLGDCIYRSDTSTYWVRTTGSLTTPSSTSSILSDWTEMPAGAPGLMTIYNNNGTMVTPDGLYTFAQDLFEVGSSAMFTIIGPNEVVRQ